MASHSSSDDAARYRDAKEYETWKKKDPIARFQLYLKGKKLWTEAFEKECIEGGKAAIQAAVTAAEAMGNPPVDSMFDDVYMNPTPQLEAQRAELLSLEGPESSDIGEFPL